MEIDLVFFYCFGFFLEIDYSNSGDFVLKYIYLLD